MLSRVFVPSLLLALLIVVPTAGAETNPPDIPGMTLDFMEDFQSGIDPAVWYCQVIDGNQWTSAVEGDNGYATCLGTQMSQWDRETDMLTQRSDFSNFVVMWDMRFNTESWNGDYREVYFRSTDYYYPQGYNLTIGVGIPTGPPADRMGLTWYDFANGIVRPITPQLECPWDVGQWYTFKVQALNGDFKLKVWPKGEVEPDAWFFEVTDSESAPPTGRIGFGNYWLAHTDVDNIYVYILGPTPVEPTTWGAIKALYRK